MRVAHLQAGEMSWQPGVVVSGSARPGGASAVLLGLLLSGPQDTPSPAFPGLPVCKLESATSVFWLLCPHL